MSTGQSNYLVRSGFTQSDEWRNALGQSAPLLACADTGYCLDAPENMPAGSMRSGTFGPAKQTTGRGIDWY